MACISMPSVTIRPVVAQFLAEQTGEDAALRVAGRTGSRAGHQDVRAHHGTACPPRWPRGTAPVRGRPGSARSTSMRGIAWCESTAVSPWPGKCLVQAATPADCSPSTYAAVCRATSCGVGAEGPYADDGVVGVGVDVGGRRPVEVDAAGGQPAAELAGDRRGSVRCRRPRPARGCRGRTSPYATSRRVTSPPSSSMATSTSSRSARSWAVSAASCSGDWRRCGRTGRRRRGLRRAVRSSQSGAVVPVKPGCRTARASRVRVSVPECDGGHRGALSLHRAGGQSADGLALQEDEEDEDRDGEEGGRGHGGTPVVAERGSGSWTATAAASASRRPC